MTDTREIWARLCRIAISASAIRYYGPRKLGTDSHSSDLEYELESLGELATQHVHLWLPAVHHLRAVIRAL